MVPVPGNGYSEGVESQLAAYLADTGGQNGVFH